MNIQVPFFKQDTDYTCGPVALQMILKFLSDYKSEESLAKKLKTKKETGTEISNMIDVVSREGFYSYTNEDSTLEEIEYFINSGFPVLVEYIEPSDNISHFSVVIGISRGEIVMNDPWNGKNFKISANEFEKRWRSGCGIKRWLMVVSDKDFNLGKQHLPRH